nr:DUF397 domain-containing protein [Micromonospora sp. DSM 115978]
MDLTRAGWRKSSRSQSNGQCVEVVHLPGMTAVRDSKDTRGGMLTFGPVAWSAFLVFVRH